jgi:hypothetical protein
MPHITHDLGSQEAMHDNSLTFGNNVLHKQMDESHDFLKMDVPTILEEEDYVSEALVRDSPHAKIRRPSKN